MGLFLEALQARFEDPSRVQRAEAEILGLRQKGRPVREYVREFQQVAGRLRTWPERLLVHNFHWGLDKDLRQACVMRGVPPRLQDWFRVVSELDAGLQEFQVSSSDQSFLRRTGPRPTEVSGQPKTSTPSVRSTFRCFRCNRPGHCVVECPVPALTTTPRSQEKPSPTQKKTPERSRAACQTEESIPQQVPITTSLTSPDESLVEYDNADPNEDPMVSQPICPFAIPISLTSPMTGHIGEFQALIGLGCTRCLVSRGVVKKLGIKVYRLAHPIRFEQVDGSLLGGVPATVVTELVMLDMNDHWEMLRFIVVPSMMEDIIIGLAWLDKWGPTIWWEGGCRHMCLSVGPWPLRTEAEEKDKVVGGSKIAAESGDGELGFPAAYADLAEVFSERECDTLPPHRPTDCAIDILPGAKLPKPRMYPMTPRELEELHQYIDKNLARGFIQPARSRIAVPVLFQEKKDGGLRLCVDFRGLNAVCVEHIYPLPLMKDLLAHLARGRVFTKLDLREAYYRVRIKSGDEWKTAVNCPLGSYQFRVMSFGLQEPPAVFMQLINGVLHEHLYHGVLIYLDDILIYMKNMEEHVSLVREVLQKLLDAQLYVKLSKCKFHRSCIDYLGYRISARGVEMDPKKVRSVLEWQAP
ncbi:hypothetical protein NXF25_019075 [Crotalus adamanteus]|uniref:ribonuclease H n=1 Tax=Crotalus adamanteus TaxID=8729 RepID=A0AAW1B123_CROAD